MKIKANGISKVIIPRMSGTFWHLLEDGERIPDLDGFFVADREIMNAYQKNYNELDCVTICASEFMQEFRSVFIKEYEIEITDAVELKLEMELIERINDVVQTKTATSFARKFIADTKRFDFFIYGKNGKQSVNFGLSVYMEEIVREAIKGCYPASVTITKSLMSRLIKENCITTDTLFEELIADIEELARIILVAKDIFYLDEK